MSNVSLIDGHIDGKQTNYDRIRNMSIEEMAKMLAKQMPCEICPCNKNCNGYLSCNEVFEQWLEQEVEE